MGKKQKRKLGVFFLFVHFLSFINLIPVSAKPPESFYMNLKTIHGENPNWSYNEFVAQIDSIAKETLSPKTNTHNDWINPYVYKNYNQKVVYGTPHGRTSPSQTEPTDFYYNKNGCMFNLNNNKQGEYRHLGYNETGSSVTNDSWFNEEYQGGGRFSSLEDYKAVSYTTITGARQTWHSLDENMRNYIANSKGSVKNIMKTSN